MSQEDEVVEYEERLKHVTKIAKPMASKKLTSNIYKLINKAKEQKNYLRPGLKEVQKRLRKGEKGIVVLAGDAQPIDCMAHIPGVCETKDIAYCYVPSRQVREMRFNSKGVSFFPFRISAEQWAPDEES